MTKRPTVFPELNIVGAEPPKPAAPPPPAPTATAPAPERPAKGFRTSVWFPHELHDVLRKIAFEERKTVTDLLMEGLDSVLKNRGYPSTAELGRGQR